MSPNNHSSSSLLVDSYKYSTAPTTTISTTIHHDHQPTMMEIERTTQTPRTVSADFKDTTTTTASSCLPSSATALSLASTLAINAVNHLSITSVVETAVRSSIAPPEAAPALTETAWPPPQQALPAPLVRPLPLSTCPPARSSLDAATTAVTNASLGSSSTSSSADFRWNCLSSNVDEALKTTSSGTSTTLVPPMPTNPHEIAREAMRITQEAMKKQKQQEEEGALSSSQQHQTMSLVSLTKGAYSSTSGTKTSKNAHVSGPPTNALTSSRLVTTATSTLPPSTTSTTPTGHVRLNKFVRRLHDMLKAEKNGGIVEWRRRGLLVLHNTRDFAKHILPKFFNTRNFKTFRRQLNYYGFVHVRSFSTTQSTTTALWVHQELAAQHAAAATSSLSCSSSSLGSGENHAHSTTNNNNNNNQSDSSDYDDDIDAVLQLRRVEACDAPKTAEGRRHRKEQAIHTVEEDLGVNPKTLQMEHIQSLVTATTTTTSNTGTTTTGTSTTAPRRVSHPEMKTSAPPSSPSTATPAVSSTTNVGPCWKPILPKKVAATKSTTSFQRVQSLVPAVPMEISVPSPKATSSTSSLVTDHETDAQGAANLLLLLSKAV